MSLKSLRTVGIIFLPLIVAVSACGDDDGSDPLSPESIAGTYQLASINGESIPASTTVEGVLVEFRSGRLTLNADRTWSGSLTVNFSQGGDEVTVTESSNGAYTQNGNALNFQEAGADSFSGSVSGNEVTVISDGVVFLFRR